MKLRKSAKRAGNRVLPTLLAQFGASAGYARRCPASRRSPRDVMSCDGEIGQEESLGVGPSSLAAASLGASGAPRSGFWEALERIDRRSASGTLFQRHYFANQLCHSVHSPCPGLASPPRLGVLLEPRLRPVDSRKRATRFLCHSRSLPPRHARRPRDAQHREVVLGHLHLFGDRLLP